MRTNKAGARSERERERETGMNIQAGCDIEGCERRSKEPRCEFQDAEPSQVGEEGKRRVKDRHADAEGNMSESASRSVTYNNARGTMPFLLDLPPLLLPIPTPPASLAMQPRLPQ